MTKSQGRAGADGPLAAGLGEASRMWWVFVGLGFRV